MAIINMMLDYTCLVVKAMYETDSKVSIVYELKLRILGCLEEVQVKYK